MKRIALITGITGQDGSYLAEWLLTHDYTVYGLVRRSSQPNLTRLASCVEALHLVPGDLLDEGSIHHALHRIQPTEVYHFAAQSFVGQSFETPVATLQANVLGTAHVLEALRCQAPTARCYLACSSEQFGIPGQPRLTEESPMHPVSPYGLSKFAGYQLAQIYRQAHHLFISCGIAFNHESERRGEEFVTRKITKGISRILAGQQEWITLQRLDVARDWSHAEDIVQGAWKMLQLDEPTDLILSSGVSHTLEEFLTLAFEEAHLPWKSHVRIASAHQRPADIVSLCGNPQRAWDLMGWKCQMSFSTLVKRMVHHDCAALPDPCYPR